MRHRGRIELRPSEPADLAFLADQPLPYRVRCITGLLDGKIIGIGGLIYRPEGTVWIAARFSDTARARARVTMHRAGLQVLADARAAGIRQILAEADPSEPRAEPWLLRLGFEPFEVAGRRAFVWNA